MSRLRPIRGHKGYFANKNGDIFKGENSSCVVPVNVWRNTKSGYYDACISGKRVRVHHLVLFAFHGERPAKASGLHKNDIKHDNRAENLYWGSHHDNARDRVRNHSSGEKYKVREISAIFRDGAYFGLVTIPQISRKLGVEYQSLQSRARSLNIQPVRVIGASRMYSFSQARDLIGFKKKKTDTKGSAK